MKKETDVLKDTESLGRGIIVSLIGGVIVTMLLLFVTLLPANAQRPVGRGEQVNHVHVQQHQNAEVRQSTRVHAREHAAVREQVRIYEHGSYRGRIPYEHFQTRFGYEHRFVLHHPFLYRGYPCFRSGGYFFYYQEVWPVGWDYDYDVVYVEYIDGSYYLCNYSRPGVQVLLFVY